MKRTIFIAAILLTAMTDPSGAATATSAEYEAYMRQVAELARMERAIAAEHGKEHLIEQYQALIDAHPDSAKTIQLETQIGVIHTWDLSDRGEPPDLESAYAVYMDVLERADPSSTYYRVLESHAARAAQTVDPAQAQELYWDMIERYPNDTLIQLNSYYDLSRLADRSGDLARARELLDVVLQSDLTRLTGSDSEFERADVVRGKAVAMLLTMAMRAHDTVDARLVAIDAVAADYPALQNQFSDLFKHVRNTVRSLDAGTQSEEEKLAMETLATLLAKRTRTQSGASLPKRNTQSQDAEAVDEIDDGEMQFVDVSQAGDGLEAETIPGQADLPDPDRPVQAPKSGAARFVIPAALAIGVAGGLLFIRRRFAT